MGKWEYQPDLACGECISRGFNYCYRNGDSNEPTLSGKVLSDRDMPAYDNINVKPNTDITESICCKDNEDTENCREIVKDGDVNKRNRWLCSHTYEDTTYSLHVCPFKRSSCGPN